MAVMEMASAAGITLVPDEERNPLTATTFGVGEMIADAVRAGARRFVVGIGGSATNDCGAGMLQALGFSLCDADGNEIARGGAALKNVCAIDATHAMPELAHCEFKIACDVTNPLCGENGASAVFGPQKGATPAMMAELDAALANFADAAGKCDDARYPGAGAAGGLGFAFKAFLGGELKRGIEIVLDVTRFAEYAAAADVVVTGEGRLDAQTAMGKAPVGVAAVAKRFGKKIVAFAGALGEGAEAVNAHGIDAFFPILRSITTLEAALDKATAAANLSATVEQVFRILKMQEI
jgi:glycerate kinase